MTHQIDILPSDKIDKFKWDNCIARSDSGLIYAYSWYLDKLADNWSGIVVNDYECVIAVPWRKKMGIRYCYDVPFIQQLGYYTNIETEPQLLVDAFKSFIKYGHYNFNYANHEMDGLKGVKQRTNFIIDLIDKETITNNFSKGFKQSLKNTSQYDLTYTKGVPGEAIELYKKLYSSHVKNIFLSDYDNFLQLAESLFSQNKCYVRKIINNNGKIVSAALLLKDDKRIYNVINATNEEGRRSEANYLLYSEMLSEFAGTGLLFDFEGSDIPGVKSFYKKTGAVEQPYYRMHINNLPFPLKLFKA